MVDSLTTECGICNEHYGDGPHMPRVLHSGPANRWKHTFCSNCLTQHFRDGVIKCPFCREDIAVVDSVDKLPVDADCFARMSGQAISWTEKVCTMCDKPAELVCHPCGFFLCGKCKDGHEQFRMNNNHNYININLITEKEKATFTETVLCKRVGHNHYVIDRYCLECKVIGCPNCMAKDHGGHNATSTAETLATKKEQLKKHLDQSGKVEKTLGQSERRRDVLKRQEDESSQAIENIFRQLRDVLASKEKECQADVKGNSERERTTLEDRIRVLHTIKDLNDSSEQYFKETSTISTVKCIEFIDVMERAMETFKDMPLILNQRDTESEVREFKPQENIQPEFVGWVNDTIGACWKGCDLPKGPTLPGKEICILVLGKPKSSRGKMCHFLMRNDWKSDKESRRRPGCKVWIHDHEGTGYRLVYTPGITNPQAKGGAKRESSDISQLTASGPHVFLVVVKNPDEDVSFLNEYRGLFGTDITRHLIVVFTGKKDLDQRKVTIQIYVQNRKGALKSLVETADNRYIACNPWDKNDEVRFRNELFDMVKKLVQRNEHAFVTLKD